MTNINPSQAYQLNSLNMVNNYKILVVEDDQGLRELLTKELLRNGFKVESRKSGAEAMKWALDNPYSLLILDYKLPDLSAQEVIIELNKKQINSRYIIMTGHGDIKVAVEMMKLGVKDYIIKDTGFLDLIPNAVYRTIEEMEKEKKLIKAEDDLQKSNES